MNQDQFLSLLRTVLQIAGTILVSHGTLGINGALWEQIRGVVIVIGFFFVLSNNLVLALKP